MLSSPGIYVCAHMAVWVRERETVRKRERAEVYACVCALNLLAC